MPKRSWKILFALITLALLTSCGSSWQAVLARPAGGDQVVDGRFLGDLARFAEEVDGQEAVPLERVLVAAGYQAVERLAAIEPDGARHEFAWAEVASQSWWLPDGRLRVGTETFAVARVEVTPPALLSRATAHITDVAPTVAAALGLPAPAQATGQALEVVRAGHVLLVLLDGFGYLRYQEARAGGLVPNLAALGEPRVGLTVYPPITTVATAALLTGAPPAVNGVERSGLRQTQVETILDVVAAAGRRTVAVEGESLPFNLRGADARLSGDRDGNGRTDDNVLANTLAVLQEGMPDLLLVHFHGVDDAGHTYGPGAPEERAVIAEEDGAVGTLLAALPPDVLIILVADHGMHPVQEAGRLGNHGQLVERDMFIPVWVVSR
jgi:hypothetical protein